MRLFLGVSLLLLNLSQTMLAKSQEDTKKNPPPPQDNLAGMLTEDNGKTVLDYPYQKDQQDFPSSLQFKEIKTGKKNKIEVLQEVIQLTSNPSKEDKAAQNLFLGIYDRLEKGDLKFSDDEKVALLAWDKTYGKKLSDLAKKLKKYDFCQVKLTLEDHVQNFSTLIDASRNYLFAGFFSFNVNQDFPDRVEDVISILNASHECRPSILEALLNLASRLTIAELTQQLATQKKLDQKNTTKIANLIGDQVLTKNIITESFRREFWVVFYKSSKDLTETLLDIQKAYSAKFPNDKNPIFDEQKFLTRASHCFSTLVDTIEKNTSLDKEPEACQIKTLADNNLSDINSNKLDQWNKANQETPIVFNEILIGTLLPKKLTAKLKFIIEDKQKLEKLVNQLQKKQA